MAEKNDGGPAFPTDHSMTAEYTDIRGGMTLRDYFAAKAMQAEIICTCSDATPEAAEALVDACHREGHTPEYHIGLNAYKMADAMLKAREA